MPVGCSSLVRCIIMNFNSLESSRGKLSGLCYGAIGKWWYCRTTNKKDNFSGWKRVHSLHLKYLWNTSGGVHYIQWIRSTCIAYYAPSAPFDVKYRGWNVCLCVSVFVPSSSLRLRVWLQTGNPWESTIVLLSYLESHPTDGFTIKTNVIPVLEPGIVPCFSRIRANGSATQHTD